MKRSVRDAIVGFSIIGGIVAFAGSLMWIRGARLGSKSWTITANFSNGSGLSERSPVTYRGILIGSIQKIKVTPKVVHTILKIDNNEIDETIPINVSGLIRELDSLFENDKYLNKALVENAYIPYVDIISKHLFLFD